MVECTHPNEKESIDHQHESFVPPAPQSSQEQKHIDAQIAKRKSDKTEQEECSICMDIIGSVYHKLKCGHKFHINCLDEWSNENKTCPLCRNLIKIVQDEHSQINIWHQTAIEKLKKAVIHASLLYFHLLEFVINISFNPVPIFASPYYKKIFTVSPSFKQSVTNKICQQLDEFQGIDINKLDVINEANYNESINLWFDNIKYKWIGDYLFYPFLFDLLPQQIIDKLQPDKYRFHKSYFNILNHIISKNIIFTECFTKSDKLFTFFKSLGTHQSVPFVFPVGSWINAVCLKINKLPPPIR